MPSLLFGASVFILVLVATFQMGKQQNNLELHVACVAKYDYLPHNQVDSFCTELLKFDKGAK